MEQLSFGVTDAKFEAGVFSGRVHTYGNVTTDPRRHSFRPGVFQRSIAGGKIRAYWGHGSVLRMGSQKAGSLSLTDNGNAVDFAVKPPDTTYAKDLKALVDAGEEIGVSFEFEPGEFVRRKDGGKEWVEGELIKVNFVEDPAFEGTQVILNSAQKGESARSQAVKIRAGLHKS